MADATDEDMPEMDEAPSKPNAPSSCKGSYPESVKLFERELLLVERERLQVDKEQLQVSRQIQSSLNEISQSLQLFLQFHLQKHGMTVLKES